MKYTQREKTVAQVAARLLCEELAARNDVVAATYSMECWLTDRNDRARGRADAVVAALLRDGSTYTISVEAKSMRTLRALETRAGCVGLFAIAATLGAAFAAATWWTIRGFWGIAAAVVMFFSTALFVVWLLDRFRVFVTRAPVIDQSIRYPGNERWLAVAQDAARRSTAFDELLMDCRRAGVGVLGIPRKGEPVWHIKAVRNKEPGNKLGEYVRGDKILTELNALATKKRRTDASQPEVSA